MLKASNTRSAFKRAFTLVELMVVIAIIALLTGIIVNNLIGSRAKGRDAKRISDLGQIQLALELFFDRCKQYPATWPLDPNYACPSNATVHLKDYIAKIPTPPGGTPTSYDYATNGSAQSYSDYILHVTLEGYNEVLKDSASNPGYTVSGQTSQVVCSTGATPATDRDYCLGPK